MLWPGMYDPQNKITLSDIAKQHSTLSKSMFELAEIYKFFLAPMQYEKRIIERIEAALAKHLYQQDGQVGDFQEKGIRYFFRRQNEEPSKATITNSKGILGLPLELEF